MKSRTFVDTVTLHAIAGRGGHGVVSFRHEKFVPMGGPDGGDGGRGGHVILRGDRNEDSLVRVHFTPHQRAQDGDNGGGSRRSGSNGADVIVRVPCGTEVRDSATGRLIGDVLRHDEELTVAKGGRGGRGNWHWKSSTHQAPLEHTDGQPGDVMDLLLTLKTIGDVGLVGFPNAGKSSLLAGLTAARPKIAPYPFTTLHPVIGTIEYEDYTRVTVADIPGLIEGAHEGVGLGHDFLRHIERAACLLYVVDMGAAEGRRPYEDYRCLRRELECHAKGMSRRPSLVVANKMDLPEAAEHLREFRRRTRTRPIPISALTGDGLTGLRQAIRDLVRGAQNAQTSSTQAASVSSITRRSAPSATPPDGGIPASRQARKSWSMA